MSTESAVDNTSIYEELENYPWDSDKEFQGGLKAILGPNPSLSQPNDLTLHARCFYFSRKMNTPIDFNGYKAYLASKQATSFSNSASKETTTATTTRSTSSNPDSISISGSKSTSDSPSPTQATSLQPYPSLAPNMAASNTPTDPSTFAAPSSGSTLGAQAGAPYPRSFAEIVALIQSGAPIPGIREIDDTPSGLAASPPSVMPKRRKPWEKDVPEEVIQGRGPGTFGDRRDQVIEQEYPDT